MAKQKLERLAESAGAFLTAKEVAERLRIGVRTLRRMSQDGRLPPAVKLGRVLRWSEAQIAALQGAAA